MDATEYVFLQPRDSREAFSKRSLDKLIKTTHSPENAVKGVWAYQLSRRRIGRIMQENGLLSKYTCKKYRVNTKQSNESTISNELNREFTIGQQ